MTGRAKPSFEKKYGKVEGAKMYRRLQQEAAHKSNHVQQQKRIAKQKKG
jgi:hypothetical protein